jgi:enoyl-CoA hydratase/carnithine racemase
MERPANQHDTYETLTVHRPSDGVVVLSLTRPHRFNAMNTLMFSELAGFMEALRTDREVRALIITGSGTAFCSGYDLGDVIGVPDLSPLEVLDMQEHGNRAIQAVYRAAVPVIAAVNGPATGGGMSLALACDIRLASPRARFNAAFVKIGFSAGDYGCSWLLPRLIGPGLANEICFTGRFVDATEAAAIGLVNRVDDDALAAATMMADQIAANSPGGLRVSKTALQAGSEISSFSAALELENRGQALLASTRDMTEALHAFREGRRPEFRGE